MDNTNEQNYNLDVLIESVLFYSGEEYSLKELAELFECEESEIQEALLILKEKLKGRGVVLGIQGNKVYLGTSPMAHKYIEKISTKELSGDLTGPLLETLTIILYESPVLKTHIDYIRGVNTTTALRHLMARGLVERKQKGNQSIYSPTQEALRLVGVTSPEDLPEFQEARDRLGNALVTFEQNEVDK